MAGGKRLGLSLYAGIGRDDCFAARKHREQMVSEELPTGFLGAVAKKRGNPLGPGAPNER